MPGFAVAQPLDEAQWEGQFTPGTDPADLGFLGGAQASYDNSVTNGRLGARDQMLEEALSQRNLEILQRVGPAAFDEVRRAAVLDQAPPDPATAVPTPLPGQVTDFQSFTGGYGEDAVDRLRIKHPQAMAGVATAAEVRAQVDARLTAIGQRAALAGQQHPVAGLLGGVGGALTDPVNVELGFATGGLGEGLPIAGRILAQSLLWGGLAAAEAPGKAAEAARVGGPAYGLPEAGSDVLSGLAAGPIFEGVVNPVLKATLGPLLRAAAARFPRSVLDDLPSFAEPIFAADPVARGAAMSLDAGLRDMAAVGPLRAGADFDAGVYALQTGAPPPFPEPTPDVGDLFAAPAPAQLGGVGPRETLANGATVYDAAGYRGRAIYNASFDPRQVQTDAAAFQYKADGDAQGVTARLRGVQAWDPTSSGKVIVYEDAAGQLKIADGHQRLGLAKRLASQGFTPHLDGILLRQADGWSAPEVRTIAALKNIREGQGTPLDAAKVFRASPASLNDDSLPMTGGFIQQAKGLARLAPEAFGAVVNKVIPENQGAMIGELAGARPDLHEGLVRLLHAGDPANLDEAHALIHEALLDDWVRSEGAQSELFGESPAQSLAIARARLRAWLVRSLRTDARLFGQLVRHADAIEAGGNTLARDANEAALATNQAALEIVAKLGMRAGPVGEAMTEAARQIAEGARAADAGKGVLARVRGILKRGERLDLARAADLDPPPPSDTAVAKSAEFGDVGGKAQAAQIVPKPEEAEGEAAELPTSQLPQDDLFGGIEDDSGPTAALEHLKVCAPGSASG